VGESDRVAKGRGAFLLFVHIKCAAILQAFVQDAPDPQNTVRWVLILRDASSTTLTSERREAVCRAFTCRRQRRQAHSACAASRAPGGCWASPASAGRALQSGGSRGSGG
jgi:hypothetical protein